MSSLSRSAIHLGGELVIGCEDITKVSAQSPFILFIGQAYILQYVELVCLSSLFIKASHSKSNSHFCKMQQILQHRALYKRLQDNQDYKTIKHNSKVSNYTKQGECHLTLLRPQVWWRPVQLLKAQQRGLKIITWHDTNCIFAFSFVANLKGQTEINTCWWFYPKWLKVLHLLH